jgi:hypothetical protein
VAEYEDLAGKFPCPTFSDQQKVAASNQHFRLFTAGLSACHFQLSTSGFSILAFPFCALLETTNGFDSWP